MQRALVQNGTIKPTSAMGYIGTQTLDDIKAFQANRGLVVDGLINPNGPTAAVLMDGTIDQWRAEQKPKAGKRIQIAFLDKPVPETLSKGGASLRRVFNEAWDGTAAKRRADNAAEKDKKERAYNKAMQQHFPGYEFGGNNLNKPYNNTATDAGKMKVVNEIGIIAGKEVLGGAAKISSIPVGKNNDALGKVLDLLGDGFLDSAEKDKNNWDYNK